MHGARHGGRSVLQESPHIQLSQKLSKACPSLYRHDCVGLKKETEVKLRWRFTWAKVEASCSGHTFKFPWGMLHSAFVTRRF